MRRLGPPAAGTAGASTGALTWATLSMATAAAAAIPARARSSTEGCGAAAGSVSEPGELQTGADEGSTVSGCGAANGDEDASAGVAFGKWSSPAEKLGPGVMRLSSLAGVVGVPELDASEATGGTGVGATLRGPAPAGRGARGAPVRGFVPLGRRTAVVSESPGSGSPLVGAGAEDASIAGAVGSFDHRSLSGIPSLTVGHLRTALQAATESTVPEGTPRSETSPSCLEPSPGPAASTCAHIRLQSSRLLHRSFTNGRDAFTTRRWE